MFQKTAMMFGIAALLSFNTTAYDNFAAAKKEGDAQLRGKKYEEAATTYAEALKLAASHNEKYQAMDRLIESYDSLKKYDEEDKLRSEMLALPELTPQQRSYIHFRHGWLLRYRKQGDAAVAAFEAGSKVEPATASTHACMAMYAHSIARTQPEQAVATLNKLLAMPDVAAATRIQGLSAYAYILQAQKKYDEAVQKWDAVIALQGTKSVSNDTIASAWRDKAKALTAAKNQEAAEAAYLAATALPGLKPVTAGTAYFELGRFYQSQKNLEKAKAAYAKSVELSPNANNQKALSALEGK